MTELDLLRPPWKENKAQGEDILSSWRNVRKNMEHNETQ
jgi:hypothetical protein